MKKLNNNRQAQVKSLDFTNNTHFLCTKLPILTIHRQSVIVPEEPQDLTKQCSSSEKGRNSHQETHRCA